MLNTLGVVQVHLRGDEEGSSGRLESLVARQFGGKSLLEWILRRVTDAQQLGGVVAVVSDGPVAQRIRQFVPPDVPVFVGGRPDPLGCFAEALREFPADSVVRVSVDSPFTDPALIDRLIITARSHPHCDYISYCCGDGRPTVLSQVGLFAEWCRTKAILRADQEATDRAQRRDVTRHLYSHPELYQLRFIPMPPQLDRDDVRLTIGGEEDWDHAQAIFDALGPECLDWQRIAGLLDQHPALRERMAVLNRADVSA